MFVLSNSDNTVSLVSNSPTGATIRINFSVNDLSTLRSLVAELEKLEKQEQDRIWIEETRTLISHK